MIYFRNKPPHDFFSKIMLVSVLIFAFAMGCKDDDETTPKAAFVYEATTDLIGQAPLNVKFTNNSKNAVSYGWNFGDGATSQEKQPSHVYKNGGTYKVSLTVKNKNGTESTNKIDVKLVSPLEGTWKLDSMAGRIHGGLAPLLFDTKGAFEVGMSQVKAKCPATGFEGSAFTGWDGELWKNVYTKEGLDNNYGYSAVWSEGAFKGNYLGRKDFFQNEFKFSSNGNYEVDLKGDLILTDFVVDDESNYSESVGWLNEDGKDINAWKSNKGYKYTVTEIKKFPKHGLLTLKGMGAFLGVYFAGVTGVDTYKIPQKEYKFVISGVSKSRLIVFGFVSNLFCGSGGYGIDMIVLKFKKV